MSLHIEEEHTCDYCLKSDADKCYCQKCLDSEIEEAYEDGIAEGRKLAEEESKVGNEVTAKW